MGTMFDPSANQKGGTGNQNAGSPPRGEHLIALAWFERRQAKSGADYLRSKFVVIAGPHKDKTFFTNISLDVSKEAAVNRLSVWCKVVGCTTPFDLGKNGDIKRVFGMKPFKARINIEEKSIATGVVENYEIERMIFKLSPADEVAINDWIMDQAEKRSMGGGGGSEDMPGDDDAPPDDGPGDDIPF